LLAGLAGLGCGRGRLPVGRIDPADAALDEEAPAPSVLEVLVKDDRPFVGTGDPVQGAEVFLDDAAGRRSATTGADGAVTFEGAPTDGSASLTVWADGFVALTIAGLGAEGRPVPSQLQIGLGTLAYCLTCQGSFDVVTGEISGRSRPGSSVAVSLPGTWGASGSERYVTPLEPGIPPPQQMVALELTESIAEGARVLGLAAATWNGGPEGPAVELRPVEADEVAEALVDCELEEPQGVLRTDTATIAIVDQVTGGLPGGLLGLSLRPPLPGRTRLEYVLGGPGEPGVLASARGLAGMAGATSRGAVDGGPVVLREPPILTGAEALAELSAGAPLELSGAEWAGDHPRFFVIASAMTGEVFWIVLLPAGAERVALPAPPDGASWPRSNLLLAAVAARWSGDPWPDYLVVGPGWARSHLLELSYHATAARFP
jgi:hypothetical protein